MPKRRTPLEVYNLKIETREVWFLTGSQDLYGDSTLEQVELDSKEVARTLSDSPQIPVQVVFKPVLTTAADILRTCRDANGDPNCVGVIAWMHTFSPAKMWIAGLTALQKPFLHLHTQFNAALPWAAIDMDYMNLHQSAHGDREFGFIAARLRLRRQVVAGHWQDKAVQSEIGRWARAARAWVEMQGTRIARFGDNMRDVAVTDGDKVEAQIQLGYEIQGYGIGDLVEQITAVQETEIRQIIGEYGDCYELAPEVRANGVQREALLEQARIEAGMRRFLNEGDFVAFTTNFQDLHGLPQLPGLAVQRLMADGYGFGAEGDWKTAALVRTMKVMADGLPGGTSFMEDYTYHLCGPEMKVLGAHMLEVCPSIAAGRPRVEVHPLSIGGKADPARLVFETRSGPAVNASLIDLGDRFRLVVNAVEVVSPEADLPNLPVARALWMPEPDLKTAATAWILAGGAHHTSFSQPLTAEDLQVLAEIAGIECVVIDRGTSLHALKNELRWNEASYHH